MDLNLKGRAAVVTGATRGVGRAVAVMLAQNGVDVGIAGRDVALLQAVEEEVRSHGVNCVQLAGDLRSPEVCTRIITDAVEAFNRLDILVNNASAMVDSTPMSLDDASDEEITARFVGKTMPAIRCTRAALPYLRKSESARVVFVAGTSVRTVFLPAGNTYISGAPMVSGIGNSALTNFARHLANQVTRDGILVNVVHPGSTKSDRYPERVNRTALQHGISHEEAEALLASSMPLGRLVNPEEIAAVVTFLSSPLASGVAGQSIAVDGGSSPIVSY